MHFSHTKKTSKELQLLSLSLFIHGSQCIQLLEYAIPLSVPVTKNPGRCCQPSWTLQPTLHLGGLGCSCTGVSDDGLMMIMTIWTQPGYHLRRFKKLYFHIFAFFGSMWSIFGARVEHGEREKDGKHGDVLRFSTEVFSGSPIDVSWFSENRALTEMCSGSPT